MQSSLILKKDRHVHYSPNTTLTRQLGKPKVVHSWKMEVGKAKAAHASKKKQVRFLHFRYRCIMHTNRPTHQIFKHVRGT